MEVYKYNDSKEPFFQDQRVQKCKQEGKKKAKQQQMLRTKIAGVLAKGLWDGDLPGGPAVTVTEQRGRLQEAVTQRLWSSLLDAVELEWSCREVSHCGFCTLRCSFGQVGNQRGR